MIALLLALGSSLAYGCADFLGGLGARKAHVLRTVMVAAPALARGRAAAVAVPRRLVRHRRPRLGRGLRSRLGRRVRPALPHAGDRPDERAVARDRAGLRRAARRRRTAAGRAPGRRRDDRPAARAGGGGAGQRRTRGGLGAPLGHGAAAGPSAPAPPSPSSWSSCTRPRPTAAWPR
ncbi:hypothetical protein LT493_00825 [Streptomyces tricolor]|nr:hypothetical protein [Streptomyces tricolor]